MLLSSSVGVQPFFFKDGARMLLLPFDMLDSVPVLPARPLPIGFVCTATSGCRLRFLLQFRIKKKTEAELLKLNKSSAGRMRGY